ncbi:MAG: efflux RND transporter permease subunit, partial [candidate division KSB1 bacterium]|nr:efflux RND transporter permease subunit [candidate division KSB1 bacterium]
MALSVGMLVDNSIVVLESIFRHREEGEGLQDAALNGTSEVAMAITASTLTTLAVFVPVLFVPGLAGELFNDMVVTICFSLTISLLVALTFTPLFASRFLVVKEKIRSSFLSKVGARIGGWLDNLHEFYSRALSWSLEHRKAVILTVLGVFILSIIILVKLGGNFLPESDQGFIAIAVDRSPGVSLDEMERSMNQIDKIIAENVPEA